MEATRIAYLSGLFDGEGYIRVNKSQSKKSLKSMQRITPDFDLTVGITNSVLEVVEPFKENWGGYIYANKRDNRKIIFQWIRYGQKAEEMIRLFQPYLIIKQKKAILALEYQEYYNSTKSRGKTKAPEIVKKLDEYYWKFRELNAKGSQWLVSHQQRLSEELQSVERKYKIYKLNEAIVRTTRERVEASRNA
ncbi:MAG TPA: LAGLIDADG family homing endonuclease [Thermodesulfobacteriota bacterium]|nr:LAGLIDADG family homing endonuclease [Thermodesulfobacteriota bacterium]